MPFNPLPEFIPGSIKRYLPVCPHNQTVNLLIQLKLLSATPAYLPKLGIFFLHPILTLTTLQVSIPENAHFEDEKTGLGEVDRLPQGPRGDKQGFKGGSPDSQPEVKPLCQHQDRVTFLCLISISMPTNTLSKCL